MEQTRLHIVEFRGFERFILGRPYWEVPVIVQRLCGICPVSHHLAAAKAMDRIVGGEQLTPTAEKMRRLMHYGQMFQSHALHFFHLSSPDLLFGTDGTAASAFGAPVEQRNVLAVAAKYPELAVQGVMMRRYGQEVIKATAGKKIHGTGAIPGGVNKNLSIAERDALLREVDQMLAWARGAVKIARDFTIEHLAELIPFGSFDSNHLSLVRESDGALDLYHGVLRAVDKDGRRIVNDVDYQRYLEVVSEEVRPWSYMKFPFLKALGPENGWYRVGPLARLNTCSFIDTPEAEAARKEFMALTKGRPEQRHHVLPLGADDRAAPLDRSHPRPAARSGSAGERPGRHRTAPRGGGRPDRGAARHALPPLPRGPERRGHDVQPHRLHDQQQRADEPRHHQGGARTTSPARARSPRGC